MNAKGVERYSHGAAALITIAPAKGVNKDFCILVYHLGQPRHRPV
jgi:hypothetical protein